MFLREGLEALVRDWIDLHEEGGTNLSVEEVVRRLGGKLDLSITPQMKPVQIAGLIESHLQQIPGGLDRVRNFMAQFGTPGELLEEIDLDCMVCDLEASDNDDLQVFT
ncbi:MAG: hypothetical protein WCG31_00615 [Deltaproteobacteria bacterium]